MESYEISKGKTIVTKADRRGVAVSGQVLSKGTKNCKVKDANSQIWTIPYSMIIACSETVTEVKVLSAKKGDIVVTANGQKFKVERVNSARYTTTRISDGVGMYVNFHSVVEILGKETQKETQREFLMRKGFTAEDVAEFEKLFAHS
jgi:hypothetical protein